MLGPNQVRLTRETRPRVVRGATGIVSLECVSGSSDNHLAFDEWHLP